MNGRIEQVEVEMPFQGSFVTVRFFHFGGIQAKWRAFTEMGRARFESWNADGLLFSKHLGSGAGKGFSILPDLSTYAWLGVWNNSESADRFFQHEGRWLEFRSLADNSFGFDAIPIRSHGTWNGQQPFQTDSRLGDWAGRVAVLTRASIRRSQALRFWINVPGSSRGLDNQPGLIFAKGVGELPLVEQATLSLWDSVQSVQAFAYKGQAHAPMVRKTRETGWYSEEMFVRMAVMKEFGFDTLTPK